MASDCEILTGLEWLAKHHDRMMDAPSAHVARSAADEIKRLREQNAALAEATKRLLCHVGLHGMPTVALEQDAEFAESVLARAESAEGE